MGASSSKGVAGKAVVVANPAAIAAQSSGRPGGGQDAQAAKGIAPLLLGGAALNAVLLVLGIAAAYSRIAGITVASSQFDAFYDQSCTVTQSMTDCRSYADQQTVDSVGNRQPAMNAAWALAHLAWFTDLYVVIAAALALRESWRRAGQSVPSLPVLTDEQLLEVGNIPSVLCGLGAAVLFRIIQLSIAGSTIMSVISSFNEKYPTLTTSYTWSASVGLALTCLLVQALLLGLYGLAMQRGKGLRRFGAWAICGGSWMLEEPAGPRSTMPLTGV